MDWDLWSLVPNGLHVREVVLEADRVTIRAATTGDSARCSKCGGCSHRVHRYRERTLADLPWMGRIVNLIIRVRHFRCPSRCCPQRIFSERIADTASVYGRRTYRLNDTLLGIGYELGGEAGAREAHNTGVSISADTLLRLIRKAPTPDAGHPVVLGVDDWSWRKRRNCGTILVDLKQHRPIDILPESTPESFAQWLREHPGVEIISRDRGNVYAEGARQGAPDAIEVADRWHILHNLSEVVERFLARKHKELHETAQALTKVSLEVDKPEEETLVPISEPKLTKVQQDKQSRRARRKARYDEVVKLHRDGMGIREIARNLGISRRTIRLFVRSPTFPERGNRASRGSIVTPYEPYLRQRWGSGCQDAYTLYEEIRGQGYQGSSRTVREFVSRWRAGRPKPGRKPKTATINSTPKPVRTLSPRQATWLLLRSEEDLDLDERRYLEQFCRLCPEAEVVRALAQEFKRIMREQDQAALHPWLEAAKRSGTDEMAGFVRGIRQDRAAVEAALSTEWSQGQTEGNINRLKMLKRQMFGRAGLELLRKRFLHTSRGNRQMQGSKTAVFGRPPPVVSKI